MHIPLVIAVLAFLALMLLPLLDRAPRSEINAKGRAWRPAREVAGDSYDVFPLDE